MEKRSAINGCDKLSRIDLWGGEEADNYYLAVYL